MKKRILAGLIAIAAIVAVVIFAGCIEAVAQFKISAKRSSDKSL